MNDSTLLNQLRRQKDDFFKNSPDSPLSPQQRERFKSLRYFPYNPALDLQVVVMPFAEQSDVQLQTNTGETRWYRRFGEFTFTVDGMTARLTVYQTRPGFFLPFVDAGAGSETYPAGRYLEPAAIADNAFSIDFNQAYNPYCAYSPGWSCPLTPAENRLAAPIAAGEKLPDRSWAD